MRSKSTSLKIPFIIWDIITKRWKALGYPSFCAYVMGLIRYDLVTLKDHELTRNWADAPLHIQDQIDEGIVRVFDSGEALKGSFLRKVIDEAIKETGSTVPANAVAEMLSAKILEFARRPKS